MGNGGSFQFGDAEKLQKQLERMEREQNKFCEDCAKELAARLLAKVSRRTPVRKYLKGSGQTGGTLRRGWTAQTNVHHFGDTYVVEIINPTEYASYVEYGHRTANHKGWVPGKFMMTISERELQVQAPKVIEARIAKYLKGVF